MAGESGAEVDRNLTRFFHPVLPSRGLKRRPVLIQLAGRGIALWRDGSGRPAAVEDACPHRRAPLSRGRVRPDGRLACAYHGWNFDAEGMGRSPSQPNLRHCDTTAYQIFDRWGYLWLADRATPMEAFPAIGWEGFELAGTFSTLFHAPLPVALDNFSEDEHFPFVHFFLGWNEAGLDQLEFEARNHDDRTEVCYRGPQRPSPWLPLLGVRAGDRFENDWITRFDPVHAIFTFQWFDRRSGARRALVTRTAVFMVPETERTTWFHVLIFSSIHSWVYRLLKPLVYAATTWIGKRDVQNDADWVRHMEAASQDLRGMRLGRFDKPVIRNRRLLEQIYWTDRSSTADPPPRS